MLEYEQLKEEQRLRIGTRDNLLYATLASLALVVAGALQTGHAPVLLLAPPVCLILGWTYHVNDDRITAIGRHIESAVIPALAPLVRAGTVIFPWERSHRTDRRRARRKTWQISVDLLTLVGSSLLALGSVAWWSTRSAPVLAVIAVELVASALLAVQFTAGGGHHEPTGAGIRESASCGQCGE